MTMLTTCPHCQTRFRVPESLRQAAPGRVRCGVCSEAFDIDLPPPEPVPDSAIPSVVEDFLLEPTASRRQVGPGAWLLVLALAAGLALQAGLYWQEPLKALAGLEGHQQALDPAVYEVRQLGATGELGAAGRIRLRAAIVNRDRIVQPSPILRLVVEDRFGALIAGRDVEPGEYRVGEGSPPETIGPGERIDVEILFQDPGSDAVGFVIDACLRANGLLRCAGEVESG
ncbi:MAG: zinc-ribbon and DUF3426 domain-containing protein [Steroidobacteraceae bacterium]